MLGKLSSKPDGGIRTLCWLLKRLLRSHDLRCLSIEEERQP
jgi:hypothetical protein